MNCFFISACSIILFTSSFYQTKNIVLATHEGNRKLQLRDQKPCHPINPDLTYFCPVTRYCAWMNNSVPNRAIYKDNLGYTRREWDYLGRVNKDLEYTKFSELPLVQSSTLELLGFNEDSHDCCHGHYSAYNWSDFSSDEFSDVKAAWELLGYNENNWDDIDAQNLLPPYDTMAWDDLPTEVRFAVSNELCYNKELWDGIELTKWTNETILPGTFRMQFGTLVAEASFPEGTEFILTSMSPTISNSSMPSMMATSLSPSEFVTNIPTAVPSSLQVVVSPPNAFNGNDSNISKNPNDELLPLEETAISDEPVTIAPSTNQSIAIHTPSTAPSAMINSSLFSNMTSEPTISVGIVSSPPSSKISSEPSIFVSNETSIPSSEIISSETPTSKLSSAPSELFVTSSPTIDLGFVQDACHRLNPNMEYFCPVKRYCDWNYYDFTARQFLRFQIGYDRLTWNYYSVHRYELTAFSTLSENVQDGLVIFAGFNEDTHDCCLGHYSDYFWSDFESDVGYELVIEALEAIGYDQVTWDTGGASQYDDFDWDELPLEIQYALADGLCYSRETWNLQPLDLWPDDAILPGQYEKEPTEAPTPVATDAPTLITEKTSQPTQFPCRQLDPEIEYWCPTPRYCEWDYFDFSSRQMFTFQLGYTKVDWNYEDSINSIEESAFGDLNPFEQNGLTELGYNEDKHDCCLNHYLSYDWEDFSELNELEDVKLVFEMLGYSQEKWNNDESTDFDDFSWDELPLEIRSALYSSLCYNKELWDAVPLTSWPEDVTLPGGSESLFIEEMQSSSYQSQPMLRLFTAAATFIGLFVSLL